MPLLKTSNKVRVKKASALYISFIFRDKNPKWSCGVTPVPMVLPQEISSILLELKRVEKQLQGETRLGSWLGRDRAGLYCTSCRWSGNDAVCWLSVQQLTCVSFCSDKRHGGSWWYSGCPDKSRPDQSHHADQAQHQPWTPGTHRGLRQGPLPLRPTSGDRPRPGRSLQSRPSQRRRECHHPEVRMDQWDHLSPTCNVMETFRWRVGWIMSNRLWHRESFIETPSRTEPRIPENSSRDICLKKKKSNLTLLYWMGVWTPVYVSLCMYLLCLTNLNRTVCVRTLNRTSLKASHSFLLLPWNKDSTSHYWITIDTLGWQSP